MKALSAYILVLSLFGIVRNSFGQDYSQQYRPQFHFSPQSGWIGDPDGTIKYNGFYHLFWWGHAVSKDLVYWTEYPWPMLGGTSSFDYYSGSVVVDTANTAGFGTPNDTVAVAIYTMHNKANGTETQGISSSTSKNFKYFNYYTNNPVIQNSSIDFRDPQVFWDIQKKRWVMVIARPGEHKIEIYSSADLKTWVYQSSFGPLGGQKNSWEVPDLFQLPLNGDSNNKKWIMTCNMGPNKTQYWVGNFDGSKFTPDEASLDFFSKGVGLHGEVFEDFEKSEYSGWTIEGTAFSMTPASGTLSSQMTVSGYIGNHLINSFNGGDNSTGKITSGSFVITKKFINFLIGGGNHSGATCINLLINNTVVKTATGDNSEQLKWFGWDVTDYVGQSAKIEILDSFTGGWGHILIDHIMFSDVLTDQLYEHANWIDYGPDFYAVKTYRDYDNVGNRTVWLGWMNNWEYANSIPTSWGGSTGESIPREIELVSSSDGYKIRQKPISELKILRKDSVVVKNKLVEGTTSLNEFNPPKNTYEFEATYLITPGSNQKVGFNLCVYGANKLVLGFDEKTSNVYLDRRNCGYVSFNNNFPKIVRAPVVLKNNEIKFHVFVDQLSVEVFVNEGDVVLTSLIFPNPNFQKKIELFSENASSMLKEFNAWELKSIWEKETPTSVNDIKSNTSSPFNLYPNPATDKINLQMKINSEKKTAILRIINSQGIEIKTILVNIENTAQTLDISDFKTGLYILQMDVGDRKYSRSFIKKINHE